jgi:carbonic anhydrase
MTVLSGELSVGPRTIAKDFLAGVIVFLVALPLCLGIAIASDADPIAGLISGVIGGIIVGFLSGSHTSVSGPAAGLTAIVAAQIANLGTYETFLLAVVIGGLIQVLFGLMKAGALSAFFPSSVIKGLLAAIGVILILKQLPLLFGHSKDMGLPFGHAEALEDYSLHPHSALDHSHPVGDIFFSFAAALRDLVTHPSGPQWAALVIGFLSVAILLTWDRIPMLKKSIVPGPLVVVIVGALLGRLMVGWGGTWALSSQQLVDVPMAGSVEEFRSFLRVPDFSQWANLSVYVGGITIAVVASLETLLNLDAVDKLDRRQRVSPPNRELFAQGAGNIAAGMLGGIPVTSVIIRGSVNVNAGAQTKLSAIFHGILLLACVALIPHLLTMIPLSCLAAILLLTGFKLASPALFRQMWGESRYQFLPFILTLAAIVMTDLLVGICIGLVLSLLFILHSNLRRPIHRVHEKHVDGDLLHIELSNQVSFLNRAALEAALWEAPDGSRILLDARRTDYIDPDVLSLIRDFYYRTAPVHNIQMTMVGFKENYQFVEAAEVVDYTLRESRDTLTPAQVLEILREGNKRFAEGHPIDLDLRTQLAPAGNQLKPIAAIVTGIDSLTPVEMIFDLGLGDAFVIRMPGVVLGPQAIGGIEYAVSVGGVKLIVVMGHRDSSLLSLAIQNASVVESRAEQAGCEHLEGVLEELGASIDKVAAARFSEMNQSEQHQMMLHVVQKHLQRSIGLLCLESPVIGDLVRQGQIAVVGAIYDVSNNQVHFLQQSSQEVHLP